MALFWGSGTFESSDIGKQVEIRFYDPDGGLFAKGPPQVTHVSQIGHTTWWMSIGIALGLGIGNIGGLASWMDSCQPKLASEKPGQWRAEFTLDDKMIVEMHFTISGKATTPTTRTCLTTSSQATTALDTVKVSATETSETETQVMTATPGNLLLIGTTAATFAIVVLAVGYIYMHRRKIATMKKGAKSRNAT